MSLKFAFAGFRHGHIFGLYNKVLADPEAEIVGAADPHAPTRKSLEGHDTVKITDDNYESLFKRDFDVLAVGDYYGARGAIEIEALKRGKHVISDKPLCTNLAELAEIRNLAVAGGRSVGCMLDLRQTPSLATARKLIQDGVIGEIHAISFNGEHPLSYGVRPGWYFEEGKHGGTINDIAIHGIDIIEWATGRKVVEVCSARTWNAFADQARNFKDAGQGMLKLDNNGGVLFDVSYFAPSNCNFTLPFYWSWIFWGRKGVISCNVKNPELTLIVDGAAGASTIAPLVKLQDDYYADFKKEIAGTPGEISTSRVLDVAEKVLKIQHAADASLNNQKL